MVLPTRPRWNILFLKAVLQRGCFLLVRITGILKTPVLRSVSTAQRGFKEDGRLSNTSSGKSHLGSFQCWCNSAVTPPLMALFLGHMPLLLSFCCGFPNIRLLKERFAPSLWEMTSPALSSISLIQKAAFKRAFKIHFLMVL